jgi:hypothetical protein
MRERQRKVKKWSKSRWASKARDMKCNGCNGQLRCCGGGCCRSALFYGAKSTCLNGWGHVASLSKLSGRGGVGQQQRSWSLQNFPDWSLQNNLRRNLGLPPLPMNEATRAAGWGATTTKLVVTKLSRVVVAKQFTQEFGLAPLTDERGNTSGGVGGNNNEVGRYKTFPMSF